jgi:hypothetical protein
VRDCDRDVSSRRRSCEAADCERTPGGGRALFCDEHEHDWVAAGEVPLDPGKVWSAVRRSGVEIEESTWIVVRDVYCARCRQPYEQVKGKACEAYGPVLRGGPPVGVRRRRVDGEELEARP